MATAVSPEAHAFHSAPRLHMPGKPPAPDNASSLPCAALAPVHRPTSCRVQHPTSLLLQPPQPFHTPTVLDPSERVAWETWEDANPNHQLWGWESGFLTSSTVVDSDTQTILKRKDNAHLPLFPTLLTCPLPAHSQLMLSDEETTRSPPPSLPVHLLVPG